LLFPGALDAINEIAEGRILTDDDLIQINRTHNTNFTVNDIPSAPFTEDDARNNPLLIDSILIRLLSHEENLSVEPEAILRRQLEHND